MKLYFFDARLSLSFCLFFNSVNESSSTHHGNTCLLVRRILIRKNRAFSPRSFVRPEISRNPFITFSETWQLVRTQKGRKNVPSAFLKNPVLPIFAKNCPKLAILGQNAQKWRFFAFFSEFVHYFFLNLCS